MSKKYNLQELVDIVNSLVDHTSSDKRMKPLTARRVRDYQSKGLIEKGIPEGKNRYYTDLHKEQLLNLRTSQTVGMSDKLLKTTYESLKTSTQASSGLQKLISDIEESHRSSKIRGLASICVYKSTTETSYDVSAQCKFVVPDNIELSIEEKEQILNDIKNILEI